MTPALITANTMFRAYVSWVASLRTGRLASPGCDENVADLAGGIAKDRRRGGSLRAEPCQPLGGASLDGIADGGEACRVGIVEGDRQVEIGLAQQLEGDERGEDLWISLLGPELEIGEGKARHLKSPGEQLPDVSTLQAARQIAPRSSDPTLGDAA